MRSLYRYLILHCQFDVNLYIYIKKHEKAKKRRRKIRENKKIQTKIENHKKEKNVKK